MCFSYLRHNRTGRLLQESERARLRIPVRDYLAAILPGLADLPMSQVAELTPTAWAARS
jgi:hypothetical protein